MVNQEARFLTDWAQLVNLELYWINIDTDLNIIFWSYWIKLTYMYYIYNNVLTRYNFYQSNFCSNLYFKFKQITHICAAKLLFRDTSYVLKYEWCGRKFDNSRVGKNMALTRELKINASSRVAFNSRHKRVILGDNTVGK